MKIFLTVQALLHSLLLDADLLACCEISECGCEVSVDSAICLQCSAESEQSSGSNSSQRSSKPPSSSRSVNPAEASQADYWNIPRGDRSPTESPPPPDPLEPPPPPFSWPDPPVT